MNIGIHRQLKPRLIAQAAVVLAIAFGMKLGYSVSNVNELKWILAPTTFFVELVTGEEFWFESYTGYMNRDHSFLIADSCSGVNFLIMAFLMLCLLKIRKGLITRVSWIFIPAAIITAYFSTITANTVRIAVAIRLHRMSPEMVWINPEQLHRLEGILIYFGCLMLLYGCAESLEDTASRRFDARHSLFRRSLIPLSIYWLMTLGVPVLTGAYRQGGSFWEHSLFVLFTPAILLLPLAAIRWLSKRPSPSHYQSEHAFRSFPYS
ncbi:MAG: exosortase K [Acidobacteriota bacterium]